MGYVITVLIIILTVMLGIELFAESGDFKCTKGHNETMLMPIVINNITIYMPADNFVCDQWTRKSSQ